jgi:hypothetical protein
MKKQIDDLKNMVDVKGTDGNWNYDPYMQGLYNGLEFALSIMESREPNFMSAPFSWISDKNVGRLFANALKESK